MHTVSDTAYLVSPGVFQRYVQEHTQVATLAKQESQQDWQWVQKRFKRLQLHRKHTNGLNIWTREVSGPRKSRRLHGYLLQGPAGLFDELPPNNPYLSVQPQRVMMGWLASWTADVSVMVNPKTSPATAPLQESASTRNRKINLNWSDSAAT